LPCIVGQSVDQGCDPNSKGLKPLARITHMGMFDHYRPKPDIGCPICGASGLEWQGKDGPCALFVWEQGQAAPVDQLVPMECAISHKERAKVRLPIRFEIYAKCQCPTFLNAVGVTERGVWIRTELLTAANALAYPHESGRQFRKRQAAYGKHPGHAG
jgi:hypothetical protein